MQIPETKILKQIPDVIGLDCELPVAVQFRNTKTNINSKNEKQVGGA